VAIHGAVSYTIKLLSNLSRFTRTAVQTCECFNDFSISTTGIDTHVRTRRLKTVHAQRVPRSTGRLSHRGNRQPVQTRDPEPVNILTALAENESVMKNENDSERKPIALAWLFQLVGDIHQPLHTAQLFTVDYPQGDRGGNEICVRVTQVGQPMDLHRFWDGVITSSSGVDAQ
jgi:hypothetical protein